MRVALISDTHQLHNEIIIEPCDLLIHAGDFTNNGGITKHNDFIDWFKKQPAKHRVLIGGNHDFQLQDKNFPIDFMGEGCYYLQDEGVEIEGFKIYGSPWTPQFGNWAFMKPRETISYYWDKIPEDTDILITHGPPYGILDQPWGNQEHVGCKALLDKVMKVKPILNVFGHIHGNFGFTIFNDIGFYNASCVGEDYKIRKDSMIPIILEL